MYIYVCVCVLVAKNVARTLTSSLWRSSPQRVMLPSSSSRRRSSSGSAFNAAATCHSS